ncbi:MAG: DUF1570 domain-containing protein [Gemmataceae bacterium]
MRYLALSALLAWVCSLAAQMPPGEWKFDVIHRKQGVSLRGLVVDQSPTQVRIRCITRKPGSPTLVFTEVVPRDEIIRVELISPEERSKLEQHIDALKRERAVLGAHLRALDPGKATSVKPLETVDLQPATWPGDPKLRAWRYRSTYFELIAATRPELAQLAAIHLEQIYAAFARLLPPRRPEAAPTTILLTRSGADYQKLARGRGLKLFNPAFYDSNTNQVVCGSDLEKLCDELEAVRAHHVRLRTGIRERRAELAKVYRGKVPAELLAPMADAEKRIDASEMRNDASFGTVQTRLFQRLYHEAFHAYLGQFVYPQKEGPLPLWFNEGLAQIFETAIVEVGELRVGHADKERLTSVRKALAAGTLLPLVEVLRSEPRHFLTAHTSEQELTDRFYLAAWGLAQYLMFERRIVGTARLDEYVRALGRGVDPLLAFRDLVGKPLDAFEKEFHSYLSRLRPDGTTGK